MLLALLEHLLEVLEDGLLKVLALLDVEGLKFFSDYPRDLFEILLSHINLEEQRQVVRCIIFIFYLSLILSNLLSQSVYSVLLASKFSFNLKS